MRGSSGLRDGKTSEESDKPEAFCNHEGVVGYLDARPEAFVRGTPICNRLEALTLVTRELRGSDPPARCAPPLSR